MTPPAAALSITDRPNSTLGARHSAMPWSSPSVRRPAVLIAIGMVAWSVVLAIDAAHGFRPHAPRLQLLLAIPAMLQLHIASAVLAFGIGFALLVGVKGRAFHKAAGWTWAAGMMTVAISSFWIRDHGRLSYIHFLSGWVSISVPMAVAAVKRRNVKRHRTLMTNMFMSGLVVSGAFTFVPGRLLWRVFVG